MRFFSILCFLFLSFVSLEEAFAGVAEEHGDGHGAHAAGHGGNMRAFVLDVFEVDVSGDVIAFRAGLIFDFIGSDIDHYRAFFDHVCGNEFRLADCCNDDIGHLNDSW